WRPPPSSRTSSPRCPPPPSAPLDSLRAVQALRENSLRRPAKPDRLRARSIVPPGGGHPWPLMDVDAGARAMLTRRGVLVLVGGLVLGFLGRLLGLPELFAAAAAMLVLVVGGYVYVRLARFDVAASRLLRPPRVHAGGS